MKGQHARPSRKCLSTSTVEGALRNVARAVVNNLAMPTHKPASKRCDDAIFLKPTDTPYKNQKKEIELFNEHVNDIFLKKKKEKQEKRCINRYVQGMFIRILQYYQTK